jgi:hypothetical protein
MPDMTPRRLRLWGDPSLLARVGEDALAEARRRLGQRRDDVQLVEAEQQAADSIDLILLVPASFTSSDIDLLALMLRESLGIGPGPHALIGDGNEAVRGIAGEGRRCPRCGASDGSHVPGCPNDRG